MGGVATDMHNVIAEDENLVARANAVMTEIMGPIFPSSLSYFFFGLAAHPIR